MTSIITLISTHVTSFINGFGYWGLAVCMALESCNLPIPSEIIQPFGGYLVSAGKLNFWGAVFSGTTGGTIGSLASYYIGRYVSNTSAFLWISAAKRNWLTGWFQHYGEKTVFLGRLLPIVRTFISLPAGTAKMHVPRFLAYTFLGSLLWSIFLTYLGFVLGENWDILKTYFHRADLIILLAFGLLILAYFLRRYIINTIERHRS